jgi:hypothetical protein
VEHYEISGYTTAKTLAQRLRHSAIVALLSKSLAEEENADQLLSHVARTLISVAKCRHQLNSTNGEITDRERTLGSPVLLPLQHFSYMWVVVQPYLGTAHGFSPNTIPVIPFKLSRCFQALSGKNRRRCGSWCFGGDSDCKPAARREGAER